MKNLILAMDLALSLLSLAVHAAPPHHVLKAPVKTSATIYQCSKCHMKVSAATAKKDDYKDPITKTRWTVGS